MCGLNHQQYPILHLPNPTTVFRHRASRFRQLSQNQAFLAGYLNLMADLADIQHSLIGSFPANLLPDSYAGNPPLDISSWHRDPAWREALRTISERLSPEAGPLDSILDQIRKAADGEMETWAGRLLAGDLENIDPGVAPFVAAALQVQWVSLAASLDAGKIGPPETGYLCPVCGSLPVASVLQSGGSIQGLRYLCCSLCATEWNRPRIHCVHCGGSKEVAYFSIEGAGEAVKAEACGECMTYIKIMDREKDANLDPFADDLASLGLDILMGEEGYQRLGFNPLLVSPDGACGIRGDRPTISRIPLRSMRATALRH